ncbi:MAG: argininosuccinate lyase [Planctomycetales bacterium]|nr:argininosuccinate lyase [Planctomycetales bacterium]
MLRERFAGGSGPDPAFDALNRSLPVDRRLVTEDLAGSRAHVRMLAACGVIAPEERDALLAGLDQVEAIAREKGIPDDPKVEDVHLWVERTLAEVAGAVAGKLHTARSRNDQVALDLRLALRKFVGEARAGIRELLQALAGQARGNLALVLPLYTHLQRAQPVLLGHHLLAHAEALRRDAARMKDLLRHADVCPLGAGAGAGTTYPTRPELTSQDLVFSEPLRNSIDAVSDRDFVLEFAAAATLLCVHLSRLGEEIVLWTAPEFGFARLPDAWSSGSSIMPQKRNPDAAELCRASAGRTLGRFVALATAVKGLPLSYNKDLQESTAVLLETGDTLRQVLPAMAGMIAGITWDSARMRAAVEDPRSFVLATDLADHLVRRGVAFRVAHGQVANLVTWAEGARKGLGDLSLDEIRKHCPQAGEDAKSALSVEGALAARASRGGTAPARVAQALAALEAELAAGGP